MKLGTLIVLGAAAWIFMQQRPDAPANGNGTTYTGNGATGSTTAPAGNKGDPRWVDELQKKAGEGVVTVATETGQNWWDDLKESLGWNGAD